MGPIGVQMEPNSPQMASLVSETTCECWFVPESACNGNKEALWNQLVFRWTKLHLRWPAWCLKPPVDVLCLNQHEMATNWPNHKDLCSDGANITSGGQLGA
jgi:hypothetical protein